MLVKIAVDDFLLVGIERREDSGEDLVGKLERHFCFDIKATGTEIGQSQFAEILC